MLGHGFVVEVDINSLSMPPEAKRGSSDATADEIGIWDQSVDDFIYLWLNMDNIWCEGDTPADRSFLPGMGWRYRSKALDEWVWTIPFPY